ncbi:MAG: acyltransferase, partial [Anaerolineae bacterium]|nr:acyltransferase [Anaerolineae bacterium]
MIKHRWVDFWLARAGLGRWGRLAARLAAWPLPPYKARRILSRLNARGFISPRAEIACTEFTLGQYCFIDDRVTIYRHPSGGPVRLGDRVHIYRDTIIETGQGGSVVFGDDTHIQPGCHFTAFVGSIRLGAGVQVAPLCSFYPYEHGLAAGQPIRDQPLYSRGDIV